MKGPGENVAGEVVAKCEQNEQEGFRIEYGGEDRHQLAGKR